MEKNDARNEVLLRGVRCPICGTHIIDQQHVSRVDDKDLHRFYCPKCDIDMEIYCNGRKDY